MQRLPENTRMPIDLNNTEVKSVTETVTDIIDQKELLRRYPVSPRTLYSQTSKGILPCIKLPGSRRLLYSWSAVLAALKRHQRGGTL